MEPNVVQTAYGKWLATSPNNQPMRIGVIGDTSDDARAKFAAAYARWIELLSDPASDSDPWE